MRMRTTVRPSFLVIVGMSAIAVALSGCPSTTVSTKPTDSTAKKPSAEKSLVKLPAKPKAGEQAKALTQTPGTSVPGETEVAQDIEQAAKKPRDLGPPLVDDPGSLTRLDQKDPVWFDKKNKCVVVQGEACSADCPLEFFATYFGKAYESVVTVNVKPSSIHAGLVLAGAEPGHPARFEPKFSPPIGHGDRHRSPLEGCQGQAAVVSRPAVDSQHQDEESHWTSTGYLPAASS